MENNRYCNSCDKWLDNENDFKNRGWGQFSCNTCGEYGNLVSRCSDCHKLAEDKENWEKAKPNFKKRVVILNDLNPIRGATINHDCFIKCETSAGGQSCGKKWKLTKDNWWLVVANDFTLYGTNACADCRLKDFEKLIAKWKQEGKELNEEGEKYYGQLKKLTGKDNDDNEREREREREREQNRQVEVQNPQVGGYNCSNSRTGKEA